MQMRALIVVAVVGLAMSCNSKNLRPGYCKSNADCPGSTCDSHDGGTFMCAPVDGGMDHGKSDGSDDVSVDKPFRCDASSQCGSRDGAAQFCAVEAGSCVGCLIDGDCTDTAKPICGADHTCRPCSAATNTECLLHAGKTVCSAGSCVECAASTDCKTATAPICDTNTCRKCQVESECVSKGASDPGVCMSQTDGHCATSSETIYVQNNTSGSAICSDTAVTAGSNTQPFCSMQPVPGALSAILDLVVVRGTVSGGTSIFMGQGAPVTSIVGQQSAFIASGASPAFSMQSGSVYIRNVTFSPSASKGISATGGMLHLDTITVDSCKGGGILLDGAAFEIDKTTVTNNGPGQQGATPWGGILVNSLPGTGPKNLDLVTIQNNKQIGLTCSGSISGVGVFASGDSGGVDVSQTCGVALCPALGTACGAP
jgi:hypothetical protein